MRELANVELTHDQRFVTGDELRCKPHAIPMTLEELLPVFISPDSGKPLERLRRIGPFLLMVTTNIP